MATIDERLEQLLKVAKQHEHNFEIVGEQFKRIAENFKEIGIALAQTNENFQEQHRAISELRAISEVHHFRIQKLESEQPTGEIPEPKQRGAA